MSDFLARTENPPAVRLSAQLIANSAGRIARTLAATGATEATRKAAKKELRVLVHNARDLIKEL